MDVALLFIILIVVIVLIVLRRNIKWGVYVVGTAEVMFRLLHLIGDNLGVPEFNALINRIFPESLFAVARAYTSGVLYIILFWFIVIILFWFLVYLIKYLFTKK